MITHVSKENNLGPGNKIRYIWGLKGPIFIIRPFEKRSYHVIPLGVRPSVRTSVRLSVRL